MCDVSAFELYTRFEMNLEWETGQVCFGCVHARSLGIINFQRRTEKSLTRIIMMTKIFCYNC